jgi:hypothetical protein
MRKFLDYAAIIWVGVLFITMIGALLLLIYKVPLIMFWFVGLMGSLWAMRRLEKMEEKDRK